jgi:multidrug efflux system outer membrane protein
MHKVVKKHLRRPAALLLSIGLALPFQALAADVERKDIVAPEAADVQAAWWPADLQDPALASLLQEAREHNQDLQLAAARVAETLAQSRLADANRLPKVDASYGAIRYPTGDNTLTGPQLRADGPGGRQAGYLASLGLSYEIDFWGRISEANKAARARLLQQEAMRTMVRQNLHFQVVQRYLYLRALDARVPLLQQVVEIRRQQVEIQQSRVRTGALAEHELLPAQVALDEAEQQASQAAVEQAQIAAQLAVLLGRTPEQIGTSEIRRGAEVGALLTQLRMPSTLPSTALQRRPDILAAQQALFAADADALSIKAELFPRFDLGAALSSAGNLSNPTAFLWNLAAAVKHVLFDGGASQARVQSGNARRDQAFAAYSLTVQQAFQETFQQFKEAGLRQSRRQSAELRVQSASASERVLGHQYFAGRVSLDEWLESQYRYLQDRLTLLSTDTAYADAILSLYKNIGEGID